MRFKSHTGLVLAICTVTGVGLGLGLVAGSRHLEDRIRQLGPNSVALHNAAQVRTLLGQWLLSTDLVLQGDESYMVNAALRQAGDLQTLIDAVRAAPLAADQIADLRDIESHILALRELVEDSRTLRGPDRIRRLAAMATKADDVAALLIDRVERVEGHMRQSSVYTAEALENERGLLQILSWLAGAGYCMVVGLSWLWITRSTAQPIEALSDAAARAQLDDSFALEERGPDEVRLLTRNISSFVERVQSAKVDTEEEVRRRTEQLVKANSAKSEFLATMSHELRTPLNGIINMNELLLGTGLEQEQMEFARTAKNAAEALLALINDILDFSKIEARKLLLDHVTLNLRDVVDGAVEIVSGVAEAKQIDLGCVIARDVPGLIVGDSMRLRQIIINLLNNAVKFTEEGSVVVRVSRLAGDDEADTLMFVVQDTGIGIPEERRNSLFAAFEQVDASTTRNYGGTGLGLAISRELSHLMGGEIGVDSEVGAGSTFWFTIHAGHAEPRPEAVLPEAERGCRAFVSTARDLVWERLREQLAFLGIREDRIARVEEGAEVLGDGADPAVETLLFVDPYARTVGLEEALQQAQTHPELAAAKVCVLKDPLRPESNRPLPGGVDRVLLPTRLVALRNWILAADAEDGDPAVENAGAPAAPPAATITVLVAEDNPINQRIVAKILANAGLESVVVPNGEQAVDHLRREACDLVLMDCQMPVMDGWQASQLIRELEADGALAAGCPSPLPIIALTANALAGDREQCLRAGMSDYLAKPFRPNEIVEALGKHIALPAGT